MVIHILNSPEAPPISEIGMTRLNKIIEKAEKLKINIALENTYKPEYIQYVFDNIRSERLGFCFDSGHNHCMSPKADVLSQYGNRLMALHLSDNDGVIQNTFMDDCHKLPFDGSIDWVNVMSKLKSFNYQGSIALEILDNCYKHLSNNPEKMFQLAFSKAKKLRNMLDGIL